MEFTVPANYLEVISSHFLNEATRHQRRRKDFTNHALYILHALKTKQSFKREMLNGFFPLNKEVLDTIISKAKRLEVIRFLVKIGLVEVNNEYAFKINSKTYRVKNGKVSITTGGEAGSISKGYRLTDKANDSRWVTHLVKDRLLVAKLNRWQERFEAESKKLITKKGGGYQITNYWLTSLKIDEVKSIEYIEQFSPKKHDAYKYQIQAISKKKFNTLIDDNGRFHHNLTNLKKELRQYLTIDNDSLIGFDIVNSQPTFLGIYLSRLNVDSNELNNYMKQCKNGVIYEYINGANFTTPLERKLFKKLLFSSVFFGKVGYMSTTTGKKFQDKFPSIFATIKAIKNEFGANYIANKLQTIESKFIFDLINYINTEVGGEVPLISLHDAVYSTESNFDVLAVLCSRYSEIQTEGFVKFACNG
jgi:hypothetical protein